ncbi:MAG TPA: M20/M25/M40 family metallo-hydrolase [Roseiflexaceae bacterium]|nr:M20/M25/M40 family metallo-hydrolase [Roseiflexaceae bacterium]
MPTFAEAHDLVAWLERRLPEYLEELRQLCALECPTDSKPGVDEAAAWVRAWAVRRGWETRTYPDEVAGDSVVVRVRGRGRLRALLAAHLDTVYPVGTAAARPLRIEGDRLLAPGSCDNKSGLLSALYAAAALEDLGLLDPIGMLTIMCGSDEETDMRVSIALLRDLAPAHDIALVLEAARENGDIVSARKGGAHFVLEAHGRAAHAGVEPHRGANAILAIARQIVALQGLNGMREGMTLNVGVVQGGTRPNVVPDYARADIDVRVVRPEDRAPVEAALTAIAADPGVPGVTATLGGGWGAAPMPKTPEIARLAALTSACATELGFTVNDAATGGVSYANHLAGLGLPVLDGLGPVGGLDHSPREYILVSSIVPRTALLALLLLRAAQQGGFQRGQSPP